MLELPGDLSLTVRQAGGHNRSFAFGVSELAGRMNGELAGLDEDEKTYRVNRRLAAERLVSGWSGFVDENAEPLEFSPEAVEELFNRAPQILDQVLALAMDADRFRVDDDEKKSPS